MSNNDDITRRVFRALILVEVSARITSTGGDSNGENNSSMVPRHTRSATLKYLASSHNDPS